MKAKTSIALYQIILSRHPTRGPQVFFPWFFKKYQEFEHAKFELYYFIKTDDANGVKSQFEKRGIPLENLILLPVQNNRFKKQLEYLQLRKALMKKGIKLLQTLVLNSPEEQIPQLKKLSKTKLKQAFTVTYDGIPTAFSQDYDDRFKKDRAKYAQLFREIPFDGLFSWYDTIEAFVLGSNLFKKKPFVYTIDSRFCDATRFFPEKKEPWIVFASALVNYKHPIMFLEAIALIVAENSHLLENWKIKIIGNGHLQNNVKAFIQSNQLENHVEFTAGLNDISPILRKSMIYVSTQEIENFPSLAMNEAMSAGNAIVARNVGRTHLFVKDGDNGFLAKTDNAEGIKNCLIKILESSELHEKMMNRSVELTQKVHTSGNFIQQQEEFWTKILGMA